MEFAVQQKIHVRVDESREIRCQTLHARSLRFVLILFECQHRVTTSRDLFGSHLSTFCLSFRLGSVYPLCTFQQKSMTANVRARIIRLICSNQMTTLLSLSALFAEISEI